MLDIAIAARSELGQRERNEDKVRVAHDGARWLAVLADGAGGHVGGAEASRRTIEELEASLTDGGSGSFDADALTQAVLAAHAHVQQAQQESAEGLARMHSTVVVLWIDGASDRALWSHVGDSRLYLARGGVLQQLTADDSVVQRMVDAGLLSQEQAEVHPQKNHLIAAIGIDDEVDPHTLEQPVALQEGDAFLLCSDGWWGSLDDEALIVRTLAEAGGPDEWLASMQQHIEARALPRQDNFSAVGVWVGEAVDESTRPMSRI